MHTVRRRAHAVSEVSDQLTLPFDLRQKSRLRATLDSGAEVFLELPRGSVLRDGDLLAADDGRVLRVAAARENVSTVVASRPEGLTRAAYHLGNRHVPVEIGNGYLRYQHDHVLDAMVRGLGLTVRVESAPFEPEAGAYRAHLHPNHD
jgi:urease accessory protein